MAVVFFKVIFYSFIFFSQSKYYTSTKKTKMSSDMPEFSKAEIEIGIDYTKNQYVHGRKLFDILKYFDIPGEWVRLQRINCLDDASFFEDDPDSLTNLDFRFDLENLVETGSCFGLGVYIFQLLCTIQNIN